MNRFHFKANKTFKSVLCIILAIIFVFTAVLFIFNYNQSKKDLRVQIHSTEQNNLIHFRDTVQDTFDRIVLINAAFAQLYMNNLEPEEEETYTNYISLFKQINLCITMYDYIDGVYLKNKSYEIKKGSAVQTADLGLLSGSYKNTQIYLHPKESEKKKIVFYQAATNDSDNDVTVSINGRNLGNQLTDSKDILQMKFVTDKDGNIIIANRNDYIGKNIFTLFSIEKTPISEDCRDIVLPDGNYIFSGTQITDIDLYCISLTSNSVYDGYSKIVQTRSIYLAIILIITAILLTLLLTYVAYRPLHTIIKTAYNCYPLALDESYDEIQTIRYILKNVHQNNLNLQQEIDKSADELRHQQVLALQSQISPHFIFNVLDSINWMSIQLNGCDNIVSDCVQHTQNLFSYCMNYSTLFATLEEELEITKSMVVILSSQLNLDIEIIEDIPQSLKDCKILKLCLEPLFENSVIHGYANYATKGTIDISAYSDVTGITLKIRDYGIGMTPQELTELTESINRTPTDKENHIGMRNVNMRLKLLFGEDYKLCITSQKNVGTTFVLHIPKVTFQ